MPAARARQLLLEHLSPRELLEFNQNSKSGFAYFTLVSHSGRRFRIYENGSIREYARRYDGGFQRRDFCVHFYDSVWSLGSAEIGSAEMLLVQRAGDLAAALKVMLRTKEGEQLFFATANALDWDHISASEAHGINW